MFANHVHRLSRDDAHGPHDFVLLSVVDTSGDDELRLEIEGTEGERPFVGMCEWFLLCTCEVCSPSQEVIAMLKTLMWMLSSNCRVSLCTSVACILSFLFSLVCFWAKSSTEAAQSPLQTLQQLPLQTRPSRQTHGSVSSGHCSFTQIPLQTFPRSSWL